MRHIILNRLTIILSVLFSIVGILPVCAQINEEEVLELEEAAEEASELIEILKQLRDHPINLNEATVAELELIPWITTELASQIIALREKNGKFVSVDQLKDVPAIDPQLLLTITPYLTTVTESTPFLWEVESRHRVIRKLEKSRAFQSKKYSGKPEKLYHRMNAVLLKNIHIGALLESDSGEKAFNDYQSYYLQVDSLIGASQIIVGHYQIEVGQGLASWGPFGLSKSSHPLAPIKKRARGLRPYTSVDENAGFFGLGIQENFRHLRSIVFYSRASLDAAVDENGKVTSLVSGGDHRTPSELAKRDGVQERIWGVGVSYHFDNVNRMGAVYFRSQYNRFIINDNPDRKRFGFTGDRNQVVSGYFDLLFAPVNFFGELAISGNGGRAGLLGASLAFGSVSYCLGFRSFAADFQNLHAFGFGDANGSTQNEIGFYLGLQWRIKKGLNASAYLDHFRHPWRTYFQPLPVNGRDLMIQISIKPNMLTLLTLRYKNRMTDKISSRMENDLFEIEPFQKDSKSSYRAQMDLNFSDQWLLCTRVEWAQARQGWYEHYAGPDQRFKGFLLASDLRLKHPSGFQVRGRITFFDIEDFDCRIYQYEPDLPGQMSNVVLQNRGTRWYLILEQKFFRQIRLSFKYSSVLYENQDTIGSGPDLIESACVHQLGLQLDWGF